MIKKQSLINCQLFDKNKISRKAIDSCAINCTNKTQLHKEIGILQDKYDKMKKKMYQKKLLGQLGHQDIEQIGNLMNIIAMKHSQDGDHKVAEEWLRRVLKYCQVSERVRIVTYNNLACVYKQSNDLPMALMYIIKAQKEADYFCLQMQDDQLLKVVTDCSLNLCAIYSAMGQHYKALKAARKALNTLKSSQNLPDSYYQSLFPIIKYNQAVQLQRLKMYEQAQIAYLQAQSSPSITQQLAQRLQKALQQIRIITQKLNQKNKTLKTRKRTTRFSFSKQNPSSISKKQMFTSTISHQNSTNKQKFSSIKKLEPQNQYNYQSLQSKNKMSKLKNNKIIIQNFYTQFNSKLTSLKTTPRNQKRVLQSVENF